MERTTEYEKQYDFDTPVNRRGTMSIKYDGAEKHGMPGDILPLWIADMDFPSPPCITEALMQRVEHGIFGYSEPDEAYERAVIGWFSRRHGWQPKAEWMVETPGVVIALATALRAASQPGDAVLIQPPVYYPFYDVIRDTGRRQVESPLIYRDGAYTIDFKEFERKAVQEKVKVFLLCSPHNPVGRVWTDTELKTLGEICLRHGITVVADEIHCDFVRDGYTHIPFLKACPQLAQQTILCTAPSKTFNLAGLATSNIFIPGKALRAAFVQQLHTFGCYNPPNVMGLIACRAAYEQGEEWHLQCLKYINQNLNYVREFVGLFLPGVRLVEPEGTYFAWLDFSALGLTTEELNHRMIHEANVWLDDGTIFGTGGAQLQRVSLSCTRATLAAAMEGMKKAFGAQTKP